MKIIFLGGPGAGKGTQAHKVAAHLNIPQISTGDLLRVEMNSESVLGRRASEYIMVGKLVPDTLIIRIIGTRLKEEDCSNGFILDGFPRTLNQAEKLKEITCIDKVILIDIDKEAIKNRLTGRRSCRKCNAVFHKTNNPPKEEGVCDYCGGELLTRPDDNKETVKKRLVIYDKETSPLIEYYEAEGLLKKIDGSKSIDEIFESVTEALGI